MPCVKAVSRSFWADQSGAVSVDWVVLSASVIGIGLVGVASISGGVNSLGVSVGNVLSNAQVAAANFQNDIPVQLVPYSIQRLDEAGLAYWTADFASKTTAQLLSQTVLRRDQFLQHLADENWTQAIQRVDYYHLINLELASRGVSMPADMPTTEALFQMYDDARA